MRLLHVRRSRRTTGLLVVALSLLGATLPASAAAAPPRDITAHACPPQLPDPFTDTAGSVHEVAIRCLAQYGFVNGTSATTFSPNRSVTRGQLASFLARVLAFAGFPVDDHAPRRFPDVAPGSTHEVAINALAAAGMIGGKQDGLFHPNDPVTRAQAAAFVARALDQLGAYVPGTVDAFTDDDDSGHMRSIDALAAQGIVGGVTSTRFAPSADLTRGAMASILARMQDAAIAGGVTGPAGGSQTIVVGFTDSDPHGQEDGIPPVQVTAWITRYEVPGLLCVGWDVDSPFNLYGVPTSAHVNVPGSTSPLLQLPIPTLQPFERAYQQRCLTRVSDAVLDPIFADPESYLIDVHTDMQPTGTITGRPSTGSTALGTRLLSTETPTGPGTDTTGDHLGQATLDLLADGTTACASVSWFAGDLPIAAHLHADGADPAVPLVSFTTFDQTTHVSDGCVAGIDPALLTDVAANPGDYFLDVHAHAPAHQQGIRGHLERSRLFHTPLVDSNGGPGSGHVSLDYVGDDLLCSRVSVLGVPRPLAAGISRGPGAGTPVIDLPTPTFGVARGCQILSPSTSDALLAELDDHHAYVLYARQDGALGLLEEPAALDR